MNFRINLILNLICMELKTQLVSLELAKEMKELVFKQESAFYWYDDEIKMFESFEFPPSGKEIHFVDESWTNSFVRLYSAYSVAELGIMLEKFDIRYYMDGDMWCCLLGENLQDGHGEFAKTEADSRAKMLIYCKENHLIS